MACALVLAGLLPVATSGPYALPCLLVGFALFRHDLLLRWRRPTTWMAGVAGAALVAFVLEQVLARSTGCAVGWGAAPWQLALAAAIPWLISMAWRLLPSTTFIGEHRHGAVTSAVASAARNTPWPRCAFRTGSTLDTQAVDLFDVEAVVPTSRGVLALYPEGPAEGMASRVKRSMDLAMVLCALPLILPLFALLVLGLRLVLRGPVFYSQVRLGLGGELITVPKLRSMIVNAEPGGVPVWPKDDDPRITRSGRLLRRFWLDELPQLMNVLLGTMSLVGPRPERPAFAQAFSAQWPKYPLRHRVPVGMTGLAQVNGFLGDTSICRRLRHDLAYARRWSPAMDLWILAVTALRAVRRRPIPRRS
jgi:lipopolysaccharide/colanic/teichoic acid biosynthesis glycosyltransferase